ncbi:hypothetical protein GH733_006914 [Mirounga leonina]|nr:hypothetical protein GH733_006914 [Mirounga leonina]
MALDRSRVMAAAAVAGWLQRLGLLLLSSQRPGRGGRGTGRRRRILGTAAASAGGLRSPGRGGVRRRRRGGLQPARVPGRAAAAAAVLEAPGCARRRPALPVPDCEIRDGRKRQPLRVGGAGETEEGSKGGGGIRGPQSELLSGGVGELSKFPLPYDGSGGKCLASFARGAAAVCRQRDPEPPGRGGKTGSYEPPARALSVLAPGELVTQAPTFKHVPPPPRIAGRGRGFSRTSEGELPSGSYTFACYLPSQRNCQDLRLGAPARPTVRVPNRGRRKRAPGVWHLPR